MSAAPRGVLTARFAHLLEQTAGLDRDADMLAEGGRAAEERESAASGGVHGLAEDLPVVAPAG